MEWIYQYIHSKFNIPLKNICKLMLWNWLLHKCRMYALAKIDTINQTWLIKINDLLDIKEIRRPIIELINDKHEYITNDVNSF